MEFGQNAQFLGALLSIVLIDVVLSGDNSIVIALAVRSLPARKRTLGIVLGVAGAAQGHLGLLWFGLFLSIPLVVFASSLLSRLMGRFPVIVLIGAAILGKVGGEMVAGDPLLHRLWPSFAYLHRGFEFGGIALVIGYWFWLRRKRRASA